MILASRTRDVAQDCEIELSHATTPCDKDITGTHFDDPAKRPTRERFPASPSSTICSSRVQRHGTVPKDSLVKLPNIESLTDALTHHRSIV